jgi:hypothetical protein
MHPGLTSIARIIAASLLLTTSSAAIASTITSFKAQPIAPTLVDMSLTGSGSSETLTTGPGFASGNGVSLPPGMDVATPFDIPSIPGGVVNADGSTDFFDASMTLGSLTVSTTASSIAGLDVQPLGTTATFDLESTPGSILVVSTTTLLKGTISTAVLSGLDGGASASVVSQTITYTGGVIYNAMVADGYETTGNMSVSLTGLTDPTTSLLKSFGIADDNYVSDFNGNATGLFDSISLPEPSTLGLLAFSLLATLQRPRR